MVDVEKRVLRMLKERFHGSLSSGGISFTGCGGVFPVPSLYLLRSFGGKRDGTEASTGLCCERNGRLGTGKVRRKRKYGIDSLSNTRCILFAHHSRSSPNI